MNLLGQNPPSVARQSIGRRLVINSLSGGVRFAITSGILLFLYPFMLKSLGSGRFGLWAVLGMAGQYAALSEFGVLNALTKLASEEPTRPRTRSLVGAALLTIGTLSMLMAGAIALWHQDILTWLRVDSEYMLEAYVLLLVTPGLICLQLLGLIYTSLLSGFQRMDLVNAIQCGGFMANALGIYVVLKLGGGLVEITLSGMLVALFTWVLAVGIAMRVAGETFTLLPEFRWSTTLELLRYGAPLYVAALSGLLLEPSLKILLSRHGGLEVVGSFEIASRVATQGRSLFHQVLMPIFPASSLLASRGEQLHALYRRSIQLLRSTAVPIFLILAGVAPALVHAWLGTQDPQIQNGMSLLLIGWLFNLLTVPSYLILQGTGHSRVAMTCSILQGCVAIGGGILTVHAAGFYGVVASLVVGLVIAAGYVQGQFLRIYPDSREGNKANQFLKRAAAPLALVAFLSLLRVGMFLGSAVSLLLVGAVGMAIYLGILLWTEAPHKTPRSFVEGLLPQSILEKGLARNRR